MEQQPNSNQKPKPGFGGFFPNCRQATRLQSDALERPLPFFQRLGLRLHLWMCRWCRRYGKQIALLHLAAHQCGEPEKHLTSQKLPVAAKERMKEALRKEI